MLAKIVKDRLTSLESLEKEIDTVLHDMKLEAVDKDEQENQERFEGMSKDLQLYVREYMSSLEAFLKEKPDFSFDEYQDAFKAKDDKLNKMLQGYMFFRSKLA